MEYKALRCDFTEYEDFKHFQEDYKDIGNMDRFRISDDSYKNSK